MKVKTTKKAKISTLEKRRALLASAIPEVRKLVRKYDLPAVQSAVRALYEERSAAKQLREAEAEVAALKRKLGNG